MLQSHSLEEPRWILLKTRASVYGEGRGTGTSPNRCCWRTPRTRRGRRIHSTTSPNRCCWRTPRTRRGRRIHTARPRPTGVVGAHHELVEGGEYTARPRPTGVVGTWSTASVRVYCVLISPQLTVSRPVGSTANPSTIASSISLAVSVAS